MKILFQFNLKKKIYSFILNFILIQLSSNNKTFFFLKLNLNFNYYRISKFILEGVLFLLIIVAFDYYFLDD